MATKPRRVKARALRQRDWHMKPKAVKRSMKSFSRVDGSLVLSRRFWLWAGGIAGALILLSVALRYG